MFAGLLGTIYTLLSHLWLPGSLLLLLGLWRPQRFAHIRKFIWTLCLQWGFLLLSVAFAWQSVDQILQGILQNNENDISVGMFRFLLIVFPVLLLQVMIFLKRDITVWKEQPQERFALTMLGMGVFAAFYSTVLAYTLADATSIANCLYTAPPGFNPGDIDNWAYNLCQMNSATEDTTRR